MTVQYPYIVAADRFYSQYGVKGTAGWKKFWADQGGFPGSAQAAWFRTAGAVGDCVSDLIGDYFTNVYVNTPKTISGLVSWYDASDASTISFGTGTNVSALTDKSTSAFNVAQATAGFQPTLVQRSINGLPALSFDGVDDKLATSGNVQVVNVATGEWSAFVVVRQPSVADGIPFTNDTGAVRAMNMQMNSGGFPSGVAYDTVYTASYGGAGATVVANVAGVFTSVRNTTTVTGYLNGTAGGPAPATSPSLVSAPSLIGSGAGYFPLNGQVGEILVYNRAVTGPERLVVEAYLKAKWGTP